MGGESRGRFPDRQPRSSGHRSSQFQCRLLSRPAVSRKYLKALLVERDIYFPKTHNLVLLARLLQRTKIDIETIKEEMARLTPYGIDVRYPGGRPGADAARQALSDCTAIRSLLRALLGL
jgi:HEPN domain-containing protein